MKNQSTYWYILFTRTGREEKAEQLLKNQMDSEYIYAFHIDVANDIQIFRYSGRVKKELKPLFPGYVFIESEVPSMEFVKKIRDIVFASKDIIRFLKYEDTGDIAMKEHERNMLLRLCNDDRYVESSNGIIVVDRVYYCKVSN